VLDGLDALGQDDGVGPLGDLDDHPQAGLAQLDGLLEVVGAGHPEGDRLGVDEQGQGRAEPRTWRLSRSTTGWKTGCTARSSRTRRKSSAVVGEGWETPGVLMVV
jgi:hypothetical protein